MRKKIVENIFVDIVMQLELQRRCKAMARRVKGEKSRYFVSIRPG